MADGCYFPEVATKKIPSIPVQRAILTWKDGAETLVISSELDSESQKLGWIIPLPTTPDRMQKCDPGSLKTINYCLQPKITHDLYQETKWSAIIGVIIILLLCFHLFNRKRFLDVIVLLALIVLICSLLLPSLGGGGGPTARLQSSVTVEKSAIVGNYEISVLKAASEKDLNSWLSGNGYMEFPRKATPIISEYIKKNWVFAAIKLTRSDIGASTPHPVRFDFKSSSPVYPMKLTALAGGNPFFEIVVIANNKVEWSRLKNEYCDFFSEGSERQYRSDNQELRVTYYRGLTYGAKIAHPELIGLLWDKCVVTKMSGFIKSEEMTDDLYFQTTDFQPYRNHFISATGCRYISIIVFIVLAGLFIAVTVIMFRKQIPLPGGKKQYFIHILFPGIGLITLISIITYFVIPKLKGTEISTSTRGRTYNHALDLHDRIDKIIKENGDIYLEPDNIISAIIQQSLSQVTNIILNEPVGNEMSPGNFTVTRQSDTIIVTVYDPTSEPMVFTYQNGRGTTSGGI